MDIEDFLRRLEWNDLLLRYEAHCLSHFSHLSVSYEDDLINGEAHQKTADRIFDWIGIDRMPVQGNMRKILPQDPSLMISNYPDLMAAITARGLGHLSPQHMSR